MKEYARTCKKCQLVASGTFQNVFSFFPSCSAKDKTLLAWKCRRCFVKDRKPRTTEINSKHWYSSKYNLTIEQLCDMWVQQNKACKICQKLLAKPPNKEAHVDHCHNTGKVRGLLCRHCNYVLGHSFDNPDILISAIEYLKASK